MEGINNTQTEERCYKSPRIQNILSQETGIYKPISFIIWDKDIAAQINVPEHIQFFIKDREMYAFDIQNPTVQELLIFYNYNIELAKAAYFFLGLISNAHFFPKYAKYIGSITRGSYDLEMIMEFIEKLLEDIQQDALPIIDDTLEHSKELN
jgi:hypothetical protein